MNEKEWALSLAQSLESESKDYRQRALFQELQALLEEQYLRIEQAEGELDGRMWSPKEWG